MRAVFYEQFGDPSVLQYAERPDPEPGPGEVRVRVRAVGLNPRDVLIRKGKMVRFSGRRFPWIPGADVAGEVETDRSGRFAVGQPVYGMIQGWDCGACAELAVLGADELAPKPPSLTMVQAAAVPLAAMTGLQALRDLLRVQPGERVCVNGASGGVGTFTVQIARILGAHVTAVCSGRNAELVRGLGADATVDYTSEDIGDRAPFDAFFDVFGSAPWARAKPTLAPGGRYVTAIPKPAAIRQELMARFRLHRARLVSVQSRRADLEQLSEWITAGRLSPVVDRVMPLAESAAAHAYIETKRARGKVVLEVS